MTLGIGYDTIDLLYFSIRRYIAMNDMIAYCGLDCEKCDAYLATINDDQALREKTAKLWAELNQAQIGRASCRERV